jgi:hypothetical protein
MIFETTFYKVPSSLVLNFEGEGIEFLLVEGEDSLVLTCFIP